MNMTGGGCENYSRKDDWYLMNTGRVSKCLGGGGTCTICGICDHLWGAGFGKCRECSGWFRFSSRQFGVCRSRWSRALLTNDLDSRWSLVDYRDCCADGMFNCEY